MSAVIIYLIFRNNNKNTLMPLQRYCMHKKLSRFLALIKCSIREAQGFRRIAGRYEEKERNGRIASTLTSAQLLKISLAEMP